MNRANGDKTSGAAVRRNGRIRQGLWRRNFGAEGTFTFEEMCRYAAHMGAHGFDLIPLRDTEILRAHGLRLLMAGPESLDTYTGLVAGIVALDNHEALEAGLSEDIRRCAAANVEQIAVLAGQQRGLSSTQAADNAVSFLNRIKGRLEESQVTLCIENVNDRRPREPDLGRDDMAFGHWEWGVDVCQRVASPNVKLLCDIYHLQIMDGDVARRLRDDHDWIGHIHIAGVPTRREIDESQELNFRYLAEVIASVDYSGYVSHEWSPTDGADPLQSIARAMDIMDV